MFDRSCCQYIHGIPESQRLRGRFSFLDKKCSFMEHTKQPEFYILDYDMVKKLTKAFVTAATGIHTMDNCSSEMSFPLKHYRGISVVINLKNTAEDPPEILAESGIDIWEFKEKFCADGSCFVMRAKDEIEHIFSGIYSVPDCLQKPYFKIKIQELSKEYLINTAALKETVKGIYGQPIGAYMKEYRMKEAAVLLRQAKGVIAEIADQVGYENQSKFAAAFRDIWKIAHAEYRKQNSSDRLRFKEEPNI